MIETRKVPDSMLLTGACEEDLFQAGVFIAQGLNCKIGKGSPCLVCSSCKKIQAGFHPDIIYLCLPDGKREISVDQIRQMEARLQVRPNEIDWRMVMISRAHKMNLQAQNALLKILEEPPFHTFFILTSPGDGGLLPTILSRCRRVSFPSMGAAGLAALLENQYSVDSQEALIASRIAGGDRHKAMLLLNLSQEDESSSSSGVTDWKSRMKWILDKMEALVLSHDTSCEQVLIIPQVLDLASEEISIWLMILASFFRDMAIYQDCPDRVIHQNRISFFDRISERIPRKRLLGWLDLFHETEKRLASNASVRLTMERFCLGLIS